MSYSLHTELERAKVCKPEWLRAAVWHGLHGLRQDGVPGDPSDTVRDHTGDDQDTLWLEVGRWVDALQRELPDLAEADAPRVYEAFLNLRAAKPPRWPVPSDVRAHLPQRPAPAAEAAPGPTAPPPHFSGTGGQAPEQTTLALRNARASAEWRRLQSIVRGPQADPDPASQAASTPAAVHPAKESTP